MVWTAGAVPLRLGNSGRPGDPMEVTPMTRRDIEFDAEGVTLRGWFSQHLTA